MVKILLVEKQGTIKETNVKKMERADIYKKCSFRKPDGFQKRTAWKIEDIYYIELWSRDTGKAGTENKYDFPPPIDSELYFGTCCLIKTTDGDDIVDLTKEEWLLAYEKLFGGFEDIEQEEEFSEDELECIPDEMKSNGYLKDGFVVSDEFEDDDSELEEEEYED